MALPNTAATQKGMGAAAELLLMSDVLTGTLERAQLPLLPLERGTAPALGQGNGAEGSQRGVRGPKRV